MFHCNKIQNYFVYEYKIKKKVKKKATLNIN